MMLLGIFNFFCVNIVVTAFVTNQPWKNKENFTVDNAFYLDRLVPSENLLSPVEGSGRYCRSNATCLPTNNTRCLGVKLPYFYTSQDIIGLSQYQITDRLQQLENLRHVPKCWAAVQPFLCALFLPKCDPETNQVDLPSQEMCKVALWPCRILNDTSNGWPLFFKCDDEKRFPPMCKNDVRELRFNTTGQCLPPLVPTDNPASFYDGIDGCGLQCQEPMLSDDEHVQIHKMVAWGATLSLLCNIFAIASFVVEWRSASRYPSLIIFYINFCFFISNLGWLAQFIPGAREDVVCRKDGTLRQSEPSAGENLSCVIVFVLIYYFLMAACVWFVILTYAWHLRFGTLHKIQERFNKKGAYFHLIAWSLPLILTITTMAIGQIDGNSVAGVCFVGYSNHNSRIFLLIVPILVAAIVGAYFLFRVLATLISIKIGSQEIISEKASAKIRSTIVRIGLFLILCLVFVVVSLVCHVYEIQHEDEWKRSLRKFIICRITSLERNECRMISKPSVAMIQLHLLVLFSAGILMSFWVWTSSTRETWKRSIKRMFSKEVRKQRAIMKKHKIIAQAYSKRRELNEAGRLSISIHESHTDPVGLNFELNSVESQDFSSTWAAALPKLVTRRGALVDAVTESVNSTSHCNNTSTNNTNSHQHHRSSHHHRHHHRRRNSYDSEISYSVRRVSLESRRHSLDSQVSVQIAELTATRKTSATQRGHHRSLGRNRSGKRRRKDQPVYATSGKNHRMHKNLNRRNSSTSQDSSSQFNLQQLMAALTVSNSSAIPNLLKRRIANAGLNINSPTDFPMLQGLTTSEDETAPRHLDNEIEAAEEEDDDEDDEEDEASCEEALCSPGQGIQDLGGDVSDSDVASILLTRKIDSLGFKTRRKTVESKPRVEYIKSGKKIEGGKARKGKHEVDGAASWRKSAGRGKKNKLASSEERKGKEDVKKLKKSRETAKKRQSGSEIDSDSDAVNKIIRVKQIKQCEIKKSGTRKVSDAERHLRASSSRSKRSVDVGVQVSVSERATQTEPAENANLVPLIVKPSATSSATQVTPPFHIRLINKTLNSSNAPRDRNYSYSALSLTDQGSEK